MSALDLALSALGYASRDVRTRTGDVRVVSSAGRGAGPTIVLLHGLGSRGADYLPLLQRLRPHVRRVIAPDFPGHGASDAPEDLDVEACLDGVAEALDETLDEPAVVFGNSLGGLGAIRFAGARPHRVRGLFLASPAGAPSSHDELDSLAGRLRVDTHADAIRFIRTVFHADPGPFRHVIAWNIRRRWGTRPLRKLATDVRARHSLAPTDLARLTMPVHLLWGRSERLLPPSNLEFFRAHLPGATIDEPHGLGHSPQLDDVGAVARKVLAFATRVSS
jgi:pimeloyl-ACP methyl ester carboxylesterase